MKKISIEYRQNGALIDAILKLENIERFEKKRFLSSFATKNEFANIYFLQSEVDGKVLKILQNVDLIIVSSNTIKSVLIKKYDLASEEIEVFYPTFAPKIIDENLVRKQFCEEFAVNYDTKIILFRAKNLKNAGAKEFCQAVSNLHYENIKVVIESTKAQMESFKFQIAKYNLADKVILYEDFKDIELLFIISDIFFLPTYSTNFSVDILKAMYYKNVVFTTAHNNSCELLDVFATISEPNDASITFKLDAVLNNLDESTNIKEKNSKVATNFILEAQVEKFKQILKTF